jgi:hypothetical protein
VRSEPDENDIGRCAAQPPTADIVSRLLTALAKILDSVMDFRGSISVYDDEDVDTPTLKPASDYLNIDEAEHAPDTPTTGASSLADLTPKVHINAGLGITRVERNMCIVGNVTNVHLPSVTGCSTPEFAFNISFFDSSCELDLTTEDDERGDLVDDIEGVMASIMYYGSISASISDDINAKITAVSICIPTCVTYG